MGGKVTNEGQAVTEGANNVLFEEEKGMKAKRNTLRRCRRRASEKKANRWKGEKTGEDVV